LSKRNRKKNPVNIATISSCAAPVEKPAGCGSDASRGNAPIRYADRHDGVGSGVGCMASTGTRVISADVALPLADQVDALADRRFGLTMEALADVDAGCTVGHAEVAVWIASLDTAMPLPVPACR
jgi:hypothetical protein